MADRERTLLLLNAILSRVLVLAMVVALLVARPAAADEAPGQIRDAEIENTIRAYATPLFRAAGLDPDFVKIYLLGSPQINAFVAGGQRLFIYTGLLMRSESANQVIGVIAHETGHIAGGHLVRIQDALESATATSIIGFVLGTAAAVLTRNGDVAAAGAMAGQSMAVRSLFAYSIGQEERADQAALGFLDKTHQSSRGLLQFFQILAKEEALLPQNQDPYLRTHPLTSSRVEHVAEHVAHSQWSDQPDAPEFTEMHKRMIAKLRGFLLPPGDVLHMYPDTDKSVYARYARAAAYHRIPMHERALAEIDSLLAEKPDDPYFNELKGQIQFESGHVAEAVPYYRKAVEMLPSSPLLRLEFAQTEMEASQSAETTTEARDMLLESVKEDDSDPDAWHQLAIAQGRAGDIGKAALALAEENLLIGDTRQAIQQATRASQLLSRGSPGWIRADDIRREAKSDRG